MRKEDRFGFFVEWADRFVKRNLILAEGIFEKREKVLRKNHAVLDLDDSLRKVEAAAPAAGLSGAAETPEKGVTSAPAAEEKK